MLHGNVLLQPMDKGELKRAVPTGKSVQFLEGPKVKTDLLVVTNNVNGERDGVVEKQSDYRSTWICVL